MPSVLFVCYGNTCRSPIAEACLKSVIEKHNVQPNWKVESAGTNIARLNQPPDPRGRRALENVGLFHHIEGRVARTVTSDDFNHFDILLAMDDKNFKFLQDLAAKSADKEKIKMFGSFDEDSSQPTSIADPYHSSDEIAYKDVLTRCLRLSENLFAKLNESKL